MNGSIRYRRPAAWRNAKEAFSDGSEVRRELQRLEDWFSGNDPRLYLAVAVHEFLSMDAKGKSAAINRFYSRNDSRTEEAKMAFPERRPPLVTLRVRDAHWTITPVPGMVMEDGTETGAVVNEQDQEIIVGEHCDNAMVGALVLSVIGHCLENANR